jgi:hypothetical protein
MRVDDVNADVRAIVQGFEIILLRRIDQRLPPEVFRIYGKTSLGNWRRCIGLELRRLSRQRIIEEIVRVDVGVDVIDIGARDLRMSNGPLIRILRRSGRGRASFDGVLTDTVALTRCRIMQLKRNYFRRVKV